MNRPPVTQLWAGLTGMALGITGFVTLETSFFRFGIFDENKVECYDCFPSGLEVFLYIFSPFSFVIGIMMLSMFAWNRVRN